MAAIRIDGVSRAFQGGLALEEVTLEVHDREVLTIVGPSGCGKSTLLRIIAGLDSPTAGLVELDGKVMNAVAARDRNIAMVFQSYALYPHMTCFENLALHLELKKVPKKEIEARVHETARQLEIEPLLWKKPRQLSGGERQRVALGRALIRNPAVFLFDEPLSNLDALLRERVRHDLKELFKKINATVVYVTHDQIEAMTLADRIVVLSKGKVQQVGTPEEVYGSPANRFVASFIGSPSMNQFEAEMTNGRFRLGTEEIRTTLDWSGPVVIGVRSEHVVLSESGVPAELRWVEPLGSHYLVGVQVGTTSLTSTTKARPGSDRVYLRIPEENIHVFEKQSGRNLILGHARTAAPLQPA
ncbi:MAG: ABC transporter ATP-binding protein [Acidobacteria bacterium]|nr:ABC transporter ATP-binding protein [Acidobacteriota bacterium]